MPTVLTHAVAAAALSPAVAVRRRARLTLLCAACAVVPDLDVVGLSLGITYDHPLGHRGLSHSLAFAVGLAALLVAVLRPARPWATGALLAASTASHGLLDMLTDGGRGVALWAPFSNARLFFPWRPVEVSPIGLSGFLTARGAEVIASEMVWVWLPSALAAGVLALVARRRRRAAAG